MGFGDELMATGFARGAQARGKRIAFGDGTQIIWSTRSEMIFRGNPNIAPPGSEKAPDIEWIPFYRGHRIYNTQDSEKQRWVWNYDFRPIPGEVFLTDEERGGARSFGRDFILVEPNTPKAKPVSYNKQWPLDYWMELARRLRSLNYDVRQIEYGGNFHIPSQPIRTDTFRQALAVLQHARLVITAEGGLHHGAAAMGRPAVVIFGSFIPPEVTGYPTHTNIAVGKACGNYLPCDHCRDALKTITVDQVLEAALNILVPKEQDDGRLYACR